MERWVSSACACFKINSEVIAERLPLSDLVKSLCKILVQTVSFSIFEFSMVLHWQPIYCTIRGSPASLIPLALEKKHPGRILTSVADWSTLVFYKLPRFDQRIKELFFL